MDLFGFTSAVQHEVYQYYVIEGILNLDFYIKSTLLKMVQVMAMTPPS